MIRLLTIILILFCSCAHPSKSGVGWQKVYKNGSDGQSTFGDKNELIDAVRLGYPIRIGWGGNRVEHVAAADFLTIFEGEVFAQIETIIGQAPRIDGDSIKIRFRDENQWTKIAGTNGYSTALMTDYLQDSIINGGKDRYLSTTWYVLYPANHGIINAKPLWRTGSPNWKKWNERKN